MCGCSPILGAPVHIELVTDVDHLRHYVEGWDALADRVSQPRAGGGIVAAWARHMMSPATELRIWIATDGSEVVGVAPFVAEKMPRGRVRLLPPATDMMFGTVPIAHPDGARQVAEAIADDFFDRSPPVDLASIYWLPEGSPWMAAFGNRLAGPEWVVTGRMSYSSYSSTIAAGMDAWLAQRNRDFRQGAGRRARRAEEEGFRLLTTEDPAQVMERLPHLQSFYLRSKQARGGEGYRFDDDMVRAIGTAQELSPRGRFALSVLERGHQVIGASLALRAGTTTSCWIVGHDPEWSRLGPGVATLLEAMAAGRLAGCEVADLGVGEHRYLRDMQDAAFPLASVTWCRPRLARLLEAGLLTATVAGQEEDAGAGP